MTQVDLAHPRVLANLLRRAFGQHRAIDQHRHAAGKTTLIHLLTGMQRPTQGRVLLEGQDITSLSAQLRVKRGLVRTFQINQLFDSMTPWQTLTLVATEHLGMGARWWERLGTHPSAVAHAERLIEQFHLADVRHRATRELAYGKRRLLEIAIALACEPRVLLLDEPVAGVPAAEREELLATISRLPEEVAILLIEHDMDLVFSFARSMTVLVNGAVLTEGTPEQIQADPRVREVYLGHAATSEVGHG